MAYVITGPCIGVKDAACVSVCPVDCIHTQPGAPQYYIDPEECIDCAACEPVCPVEAIYEEALVPEAQREYVGINARFCTDRARPVPGAN